MGKNSAMLKNYHFYLLIAFVGFFCLNHNIWSGNKQQKTNNSHMRNLSETGPKMEARGGLLGGMIMPQSPGPIENQQEEEKRLALDEMLEKQRALNSLRIAVFGTGNAYGARIPKRFSAYPYQLNSMVLDNYAHFGNNNLNYFSTCTQTAIGDDKYYDVIIFDFWLRFEQGLEGLVRKLRNRFPNSMFIFLKVWSISQFRRRELPNSTSSISFRQWKQDQGLTMASHYNQIIHALQNDPGHWFFPERKMADEASARIVETYGGFNFTFPFKETSDKDTMIAYMGLFDTQNHDRLSELGHTSMARSIQGIIDQGYLASTKALTTVNQIEDGNGPLGLGDSCNLWYSSGTTRSVYSKTFEMVQINKRQDLFALKIKDAGWIRMTNPFDGWRTIYLSFLTSAEPGVYPRLAVQWKGHSVIINPLNTDKNKRHKTKTVAIGTKNLGQHELVLVPLDRNTQEYFSLIGITITDEMSLPLEYGFGPSFELEDEDEDEPIPVAVARRAKVWNNFTMGSEEYE